MNRILTILAAGVCALAGATAPAQAAPEMSLTRFECGTPQAPVAVNERFSDIYAYGDLKLQFVYSCYLVKHGDEYLLWDTGHAMTMPNVAPKVSLVDLLAKIDLKPEQIKYVGISHYHADHTGQVNSFPSATLLIGKGDWDAITSPKPAEGVNFKPFENWIKGEGKVEPLAADKDVFGDGTVIMLRTIGHTPGHHSACPRSTSIARRRWHRLSASKRSRPISRRPSSSSMMRATSTNCRCFRLRRSNRRGGAIAAGSAAIPPYALPLAVAS